MELPKKLTDEIWEYCRANGITDIDGFITKMTRDGFTVERYGFKPEINPPTKKVPPAPEPVKEQPKEEIKVPPVPEPVKEQPKEQPKEEVKEQPVERDIYDEPKRIMGSLGSNLLD